MEKNTKELCLRGLLIALVAIFTLMFRVPVPATNGYIHLGDGFILLAGVLCGKKTGMLAGGLGAAMADIIGGYPHWALFTLLIKGCMGYLVGAISHTATGKAQFFAFRTWCAVISGVLLMVFGYYLASIVLYGSPATALASVPENLIQGGGGVLIYAATSTAFLGAKQYGLFSFRA